MNTKHCGIDALRRDLTKRFIDQLLVYQVVQAHADDSTDEDETPRPLSDASGADSSAAVKALVADFAMDKLAAGQVRLLSQPDSLCHVLLLRQWDSASYLIVPFSRFPLPATDEELLLNDGRTDYLAVLQLWNARSIHALFLRRSWLVDTLTDSELATARQALAFVQTGQCLPEEILSQMALPIQSADDPRLDYKAAALDRFAALDSADFAWMEQCDHFAQHAAWRSSATTPAGRENTIQPVDFSRRRRLRVAEQELQYAAAGAVQRSPCWRVPLPANQALPAMAHGDLATTGPAVDAVYARYYGGPFAALQPDQYRTLLWDLSDCDLPMGSYDALFIHSKRRTLLASGYARVDEEDSSVVLSDWLPCEHPPLASAADLTILLCETAVL